MTQQYTPVTWQDETTSQQGTLINAERLNQMQTAHHYADGFEEVDAVPTADPGVAYHKIVYCTADSTIYRWDGTEWTKDIDDETKALLQQEIARATAAESTLRGQLEDEHDARVDAEAAINDRITDEATELAQRIATETSTRYTADTALGTRITNETSARETADTGLGNRITAEATARAEADTLLGNRITAETTAREGADTALGNRITAETTAREGADTALGNRITAEETRATQAEQANAQAIANTYTKAETDTLLASKADSTALATKLDTLSTTGLHAYTHNGTTQSEVSVIDGTTASTIPIRDTNGRLQAADPASGATDKSLVTANWVSQTGDDGPNNLVHRNGNETVFNRKNAAFIANNFCEIDAFTISRYGWHKIYTITSIQRWMGVLTISKISNSYALARAAIKEIFIIIENTSSAHMYWKTNIGTDVQIKLTYNGSVWEVWYNAPAYVRSYLQLDTMCYIWGATDSDFKLNTTWSDVVTEPASADYQVYIDTVETP